jgi:hypothetical protein
MGKKWPLFSDGDTTSRLPSRTQEWMSSRPNVRLAGYNTACGTPVICQDWAAYIRTAQTFYSYTPAQPRRSPRCNFPPTTTLKHAPSLPSPTSHPRSHLPPAPQYTPSPSSSSRYPPRTAHLSPSTCSQNPASGPPPCSSS